MNKFISGQYLLVPVTNSRFHLIYLALALMVIFSYPLYRILIKLKGEKRQKDIYGSVDKLWFWDALILGVTGLFLYFSRTQSLPIFGTRLAIILWLLLIIASIGFLVWFAKKDVPRKSEIYYKKTRKNRYLKQ